MYNRDVRTHGVSLCGRLGHRRAYAVRATTLLWSAHNNIRRRCIAATTNREEHEQGGRGLLRCQKSAHIQEKSPVLRAGMQGTPPIQVRALQMRPDPPTFPGLAFQARALIGESRLGPDGHVK